MSLHDQSYEKVLILVKTFPTISKSYTELVCTAGIREDGSFIRLYPVPFRLLDNNKQYKKFQWVEVKIVKNRKDPRVESYKVLDNHIKVLGDVIPTENSWHKRLDLLFNKNKVYTDLNEIINDNKENKYSIVLFKPTEIIDFKETKKTEKDKDNYFEKNEIMDAFTRQGGLFEENDYSSYKELPYIPYTFRYHFKDINKDKVSKLMIEDWEINSLFSNCLKSMSKEKALEKVKEKYFNEFITNKSIYFILGTRLKHDVANYKNPYSIIGVLYPPKEFDEQPLLDL